MKLSRFRKRFRSFFDIPAGAIGVACTLMLLAASFIPPGQARLWIFFLFSGITPLLCFLKRWNISVVLLSLGVSSVGLWSLTAPVFWSFNAPGLVVPGIIAVNGAITAALIWRRESRRFLFTPADAATLAAALLLAAPIYKVFTVNGPQSNSTFVYRMGIEGDGFYMMAMAHQADIRASLPTENPFVPDSPNRYLHRTHAGIGALAGQSPLSAPLALWPILPLIMVGGALCVMSITAQTRGIVSWRKAAAALTVGAVFVLCRPDLFILPHTQALILPYLFLLLYLIGGRDFQRMRWGRIAGIAILILLIGLSHMITACASAGFLAGTVLKSVFRGKSRKTGAGVLIMLMAAVCIYFGNKMPAPEPRTISINPESFYYLKGYWLAWFCPLAVAAAVMLLEKRKNPYRFFTFGILICGGMALGIMGMYSADTGTVIFNTFNSIRFFHFAFLTAAPAFLSLPVVPTSILALSFVFALPQMPNLNVVFTEPPRRISPSLFQAYEFIRKQTPADATFYDNLSADRALFGFHTLPAFTGRVAFVPDFNNFYAQNMIPLTEWERRKESYYEFFTSETTPERRLHLAAENSINHILLQSQPGFPPAAEIARKILPENSYESIYANREVSVLRIKQQPERNADDR